MTVSGVSPESSPGHEPLQELQAALLTSLLGLAIAVLAPVVDLVVHALIQHVLVCLYAAVVNPREVLPGDVQGPPAVAWTGACTAVGRSHSGPILVWRLISGLLKEAHHPWSFRLTHVLSHTSWT